MQFRTALFALVLALLAGCSSTFGPVTPADEPDQYTVSNSLTGRMTTWVELKTAAVDRAKEYCESLGRKMVHPKITSNHATGFQTQTAYVTFTCQAPPEPKKKKDDDTK